MKRQRIKGSQNDGYQQLFSKDSDDSGEDTELFVRKKYEIPHIEKAVEEGDSLQSLAIRYHCTVAELKQLNNIHKENEIYAKRSIKVPSRPFSSALAGVHISGTSSPDTDILKKEIDLNSLNSKLEESLAPNHIDQTKVNAIIFNSHIIPKICDPDEADDGDEEDVRLLPQSPQAVEEVIASKISCSGADGDIPWIALIICIVVLVFAVPLIYVLYIYEHPQMYHHNHTSS